jgi:hypothetical protein
LHKTQLFIPEFSSLPEEKLMMDYQLFEDLGDIGIYGMFFPSSLMVWQNKLACFEFDLCQ